MFDSYMNKFQIESYGRNQNIKALYYELLSAMDCYYYNVERVDLLNDTACILQCADHPEAVSEVINWTQYLEASSGIFSTEQRKIVLTSLSAEHLLKVYKTGEKYYSVDACYRKEDVLNSMTFFVVFAGNENAPMAYVLVRNSSKEHVRKHIVDMYVYNNCDFFVYLDAKNNSYAMFNTTENSTQMLPELYADYTLEMKKYIDEIIVLEDRELAVKEMSIKQMLSNLDEEKVHSFYCGVMDPIQGYTRKKFDYRYYERNAGIILLSCTDVTEIYLKEQEQRKALLDALESARTDVLTGLLNYKGFVEKVEKILKENPKQAAFIFIDLDNFKAVNDYLGHDTGDEALCETAKILCREALNKPLIGRFGGDEFVVFFPDLNFEDVRAYAERVCEAVCSMRYGQKKTEAHISCSIGIVEIPKYGGNYIELFKKADEMTYRAKNTGKNKFVVYGDEE